MPRDQLPVYNQQGQCISGNYMQVTTAPRAPTPSTASYISTPGPVLHDISDVHCEELSDHYCSNPLEVIYNQQINPEYVRELPAHYLKHWGLLVDTGASVSVVPTHFAPEVLEPVLHPVQLPRDATDLPCKIGSCAPRTVLKITLVTCKYTHQVRQECFNPCHWDWFCFGVLFWVDCCCRPEVVFRMRSHIHFCPEYNGKPPKTQTCQTWLARQASM